MQRDVVKAWHYHHVQTDWWYLALGVIRTVLIDHRPESPTYRSRIELLMGDGPEARQICVRIPPGVLHGCRVLSEQAHLLYITSTVYDPNEEGRIPFDSSDIGYDWGPHPLVVDNDRRLFKPTSVRVPLAL
jgi:dTDP-4-dehydrorhamnose 3,5-epimerase